MKNYKQRLIRAAEGFSDLINMIIVGAMLLVTVGVGGFFIRDILIVFQSGFTDGITEEFASLLLLWVLAELIHTQIAYLKGGPLDVRIFVIVAMVAFLRKMMVVSLKIDKATMTFSDVMLLFYPMLSVLALGVVYWLIGRGGCGVVGLRGESDAAPEN